MKHIRIWAEAGVIARTDTECILSQFSQLHHLVGVATASIDTLKTTTTKDKTTINCPLINRGHQSHIKDIVCLDFYIVTYTKIFLGAPALG